MPYSKRSRFVHEEREREFEPTRLRTVVEPNGTEVRLGFRGDRSEVISVLKPRATAGVPIARKRWVVTWKTDQMVAPSFIPEPTKAKADAFALDVIKHGGTASVRRIVPVRASRRARAHPRRLR